MLYTRKINNKYTCSNIALCLIWVIAYMGVEIKVQTRRTIEFNFIVSTTGRLTPIKYRAIFIVANPSLLGTRRTLKYYFILIFKSNHTKVSYELPEPGLGVWRFVVLVDSSLQVCLAVVLLGSALQVCPVAAVVPEISSVVHWPLFRALFMDFKRGNDSPQTPLKSSDSMLQIIMPPKLFCFT